MDFTAALDSGECSHSFPDVTNTQISKNANGYFPVDYLKSLELQTTITDRTLNPAEQRQCVSATSSLTVHRNGREELRMQACTASTTGTTVDYCK